MDYKKLLCVAMFFGMLKAAERDDLLPDVGSFDYNDAYHLSDGRTIYKTKLSINSFDRPQCILSKGSVGDYLDQWYRSYPDTFVFLESSEGLAPKDEKDNLENLDALAAYCREPITEDDDDSMKEVHREKRERKTYWSKNISKKPQLYDYDRQEDFKEDLEKWTKYRKRCKRADAKHRERRLSMINELIKMGKLRNKESAKDFSIKELQKILEESKK
jgi:hypothetical protein